MKGTSRLVTLNYMYMSQITRSLFVIWECYVSIMVVVAIPQMYHINSQPYNAHVPQVCLYDSYMSFIMYTFQYYKYDVWLSQVQTSIEHAYTEATEEMKSRCNVVTLKAPIVFFNQLPYSVDIRLGVSVCICVTVELPSWIKR